MEEHFLKGRIVERFQEVIKPLVDEELGPLRPKEVRVVLRNCGEIDPNNIEDYLAIDGYQALGKALLEMTPEKVIEEVTNSGLRGRGGTGLGLAIAKQLIEAQGGEISASNLPEGGLQVNILFSASN